MLREFCEDFAQTYLFDYLTDLEMWDEQLYQLTWKNETHTLELTEVETVQRRGVYPFQFLRGTGEYGSYFFVFTNLIDLREVPGVAQEQLPSCQLQLEVTLAQLCGVPTKQGEHIENPYPGVNPQQTLYVFAVDEHQELPASADLRDRL